jgi:two-component system, cell cycle response regulator DivK
MSFPPRSDLAVALRDEARTLVERASDHEHRLDALVEATEMHLRQAEAALSDSLDEVHARVDHLRRVLSSRVEHSRDEAVATRELRAGAHEQHVAAIRLLTHLDDDPCALEELRERRGFSNSVLVADDYRELRESLAAVLRNAGFTVRTASNGLEAILGAYEMRPAVVLMDVSMPVLDGLEAARLIKAADATRHTRVIACTGNPLADDAPARSLFAAVLRKPVPPAVVVATVQDVARR